MCRILTTIAFLSLGTVVSAPNSRLLAAEKLIAIKPVMVWAGPDSQVSEPFSTRCCTQKELETVWLKHHGEDNNDDEFSPCPQVDFTSYMVIVVFDGKWMGGSSIRIFEIVDDADCVRIRLHPRECQTGVKERLGICEPVKFERLTETQSYAFIVLPVSKKAVAIEEDRRGRAGVPPVWKEESKFPAIDKKK